MLEIQTNDVFAVGDLLLLAQGDHELHDGKLLRQFVCNRFGDPNWKPAMVYSDPPWTDVVAVQFRKYAELPMPARYKGTPGFLQHVLNNIADNYTWNQSEAYLEMGVAKQPLLDEIMQARGWVKLEHWMVGYETKGECVLSRYGHKSLGPHPAREGSATGLNDRVTPSWAARRNGLPAGAWLLDPCMGKGTTAKDGIRAGYRALGLEMRRSAMTETLEKVSKQTGLPITRIGNLQETEL